MRSDALFILLLSFATSVLAQTLTVTFPNGPTVVRAFTTDANGIAFQTTLATLSGSTTPTSTPSSPTSQTTLSQTSTRSVAGPSTSSSAAAKKGGKGVPSGTIAGVIIAVLLVLIALAITLLVLKRRKGRRRRLPDQFEIDPSISMPVVDKTFVPDPFITDEQAIGMGYDLSRQTTRRLDAKFLSIDERKSSDSQNLPAQPLSSTTVPHILVNREGETTGRPITPSTSSHHGPQSLVDHTQATPYPSDTKSASGRPTATREKALPTISSRGEGSLPTTTTITTPDANGPSSQQDISRRMQHLLSQMENHAAGQPSSSGGRGSTVVVQLQRQIEMLRQENEELRLVSTEAPPAYEHGRGGGRF